MPIQYALTYPDRAAAPVPRLDWTKVAHWNFEPPDYQKFPLLRLAYEAQEAGGSATATLNAADEIAVEAFLAGQIPFPGIAATVADTLDRIPVRDIVSVTDVLDVDRESREAAREMIGARWGKRSKSGVAVLA
jgi:1-deoxy-D-xylulose-5-phosphate reductoisomerase